MSRILSLTLVAFLCHAQCTRANRNSLLPVRYGQGQDANLTSSETWYWGDDQVVVGRLTGYFPDAHQKVVKMDRFASLVRMANCTDDLESLTYVFDEAAYGLVRKEWEWVNENEKHNFILTTDGIQGCPKSSDETQLFQVKAISWDNESSTATLAVTAKNWTDFLGGHEDHNNTWELLIDSTGLALGGAGKRTTTTLPIPMAHDFSGLMWSSVNNHGNESTTSSLSCSKCVTRGFLGYTITANYDGRQLDGFVQWTPVDLGYTNIWDFDANGNGNMTVSPPPSAQQFGVQLPGGLSIAGVMDLGPALDFHVNTDAPTLDSGASVTWGFDVAVPPDSVIHLPFNYAGKPMVRWLPVITPAPPQVRMADGLDLSLGVSPKMAFSLNAQVLGVPFEAGLAFQAPKMQGAFSVASRSLDPTTTTVTMTVTGVRKREEVSTTAAAVADAPEPTFTSDGPGAFCNDANAQSGVKMAVDVDMKFLVYAGLKSTMNGTSGVGVYTTAGPMYRTCMPINDRIVATVTNMVMAVETGKNGADRLGCPVLSSLAVVSTGLIWLLI